jgi:[ribosomal protein S5]-alanine N-acetyltransferase
MPTTRPLTLEDARRLLELYQANREFLVPWQPTWKPEFLTLDGQRWTIAKLMSDQELGQAIPHVILDGERIVGRVTLSNIVRGPFQSCNLGYWVSVADNGRGHASTAVREITQLGFSELALHRVQAGTLMRNLASQRMLEHNGFKRFGLAENYLQIAGQWQDHVLFQKLATDDTVTKAV